MSRRDKREERRQRQIQKQRERQVKQAIEPHPAKQPKNVDLDDSNTSKVLWSFELFDRYDWRVDPPADHVTFCDGGHLLREYSSRTWAEIIGDGKRDHSVAIDGLIPDARARLEEIKLEDIDELWRFRFSGKQRLWGFRVGRVFRVLWWDPDHRVCPSVKKS